MCTTFALLGNSTKIPRMKREVWSQNLFKRSSVLFFIRYFALMKGRVEWWKTGLKMRMIG